MPLLLASDPSVAGVDTEPVTVRVSPAVPAGTAAYGPVPPVGSDTKVTAGHGCCELRHLFAGRESARLIGI
ncbi:hypothetical protein ACFY2R_02335 [Micromonospora olivasterospora]|uniref:hypothetical protein n=1 Tax=Micromonospora olivasterospora TaxID=1880 RepID=UPI0011A0A50E|nr:hypothetical protein [Micromonospora olivasterospora]